MIWANGWAASDLRLAYTSTDGQLRNPLQRRRWRTLNRPAPCASLAHVGIRCASGAASHIRGESDTLLPAITEAIEVGRRARVPVEISHLKAAGRTNWPKMAQAIELIERARAEGLDVTADMYPYPAGSTTLSALLAPWAHAGGREPLLARLADRTERARIRGELDGGPAAASE